jgi:hypothetical protein
MLLRQPAQSNRLLAKPSIQSPMPPGIGNEEDNEEKEQRQMIKFGAKIAPYGNSVAGIPPGRQRQVQHVERAQHRSWTDPYPQQQRHSDKHFDRAHHVAQKYRVREHLVGKNRTVETDRTARDVAPQIPLKSAVGKAGAEEFVLAEQDEKDGRGHAHDGNGLRKSRG